MAANGSGVIVRNPSSNSPGEIQSPPILDLDTFDVNHADNILKGFLQLLEFGKHSDVTFIITEDERDHRIPAHRVILASQSEYFDRLLFGEMREAHPGAEIPLQDTPLEAFQLLMKYTYSGEITINDSDLQLMFDVVRLADRFGLHFLKSALGHHLGNIVCRSNVLPILVHADLFQLEQAKANCFHFLDRNAEWILKDESDDFLSLPQKYLEDIVDRDSFVTEEIDIFQVVRRWLEHNKDDSASLLKVVRLCEISPNMLFAEVEPSGLFDKEAIFEAMRVSCKPELEHMTPRGFAEPDQNLFENKDHLVRYQRTYNKSPPNWKENEAEIGFIRRPHTCTFQFRGSDSQVHQAIPAIIIKLEKVYLVNNITLHLLASVSEYTIHVSRDNKTWRQLIDYSKQACTRMQVLWFPKQAVRYIQFAPFRKCSFQLHSCALKSELPIFAFRHPGVIAPLEPFTPLHYCKNGNFDGIAGHRVYIHQPYSVSLLRITLLRDFGEGDSIDVQIKVRNQVYNFKDQEFGEEIEVKFAETFVRRFTVLAKPTEEQTKKRKKLNDSHEQEVANPSYVGQFKITFVCQAL